MKKNRGEKRQLTDRPFQGPLKGMKVGPPCLKCQRPLTRLRDQRHGFLHDACELASSQGYMPVYVHPSDGPRKKIESPSRFLAVEEVEDGLSLVRVEEVAAASV